MNKKITTGIFLMAAIVTGIIVYQFVTSQMTISARDEAVKNYNTDLQKERIV